MEDEKTANDVPEMDTTQEQQAETPYLGSWKTRADAEKGLAELQKVMGRQGDELGYHRKQNQELMSALQNVHSARETPAQVQQSPEEGLAKILGEYGSLNFLDDDNAPKKGADLLKQAILASAQMAEQNALQKARDQFQSALQEKDMRSFQNQFLEANPDFQDLQNQGVFQSMKQKNPLHDDFSAFYAYKADQQAQQLAQLQAQLAEAQKVANLAGGDQQARGVFTKPGNDLRNQNKQRPTTITELKASALAAVNRARGIGG